MDLLPTGSDKLLEIGSSDIDLVIKSKNIQTAVAARADEQSSSVAITTFGLERIKVGIHNIDLTFENSGKYSAQIINVASLFFEQTDYELIVNSRNGKAVHFWNENYLIREKIGPVIEGNNTLITGIINFGNSVGYTDLEITAHGRKVMVLRIEVYPSKITYKEDYRRMIADVSEMVYAAAIDFMQKTYQEFSIGDKQNNVPAIFFRIISMIFDKYMNAAKCITTVPHHKLITERSVVPEYKAKRTDRKSEKGLMSHQTNIALDRGGDLVVNRVLAARKQITYDTNENRFVKFIMKATIRKLEDFITRYKKSVKNPEETVLLEADRMIQKVRNVLNTSFLQGVSEYTAAQSMSLVFGMAPGYRELYKYYLMMQRSLSVHGDFFRISVKDTAQLYEYWCFIKLFTLLKQQYQLVSPDIIKIDNSGITVTLVKGKQSKACFINPKTGEQITLVYNPGETKTQTVNQKPDNVLELEKKGTEVSYKYVFDAKYRIEKEPESPFYPDPNNNPGPKVDDINTMHRYRDSIVYENKVSKFTFEKTMFGAYILFPYDDEELYKEHHFYKSIESVNIGGLPFLPGATSLVQKLLDELISDSKESAFKRTTLPRGIEEKLAVVDWEKRDVLVGTFRSRQQFDICFDKNFYYIPVKQVTDDRLPIHYIALYQTKNKFGTDAGIRYYGEVLRTTIVRRKNIREVPLTHANGEEPYYRFTVRNWETLDKTIEPKEHGFPCDYTNMFLLQHSEFVPELLIESEEKYRFYTELKRSVNYAEISGDDTNVGFVYGDVQYVFSDGNILAVKGGAIVEKKSIANFAKRPADTYRRLQAAVESKKNAVS